MEPMKIQDIVSAVGGTLLSGDAQSTVTAVCTDTRALVSDALFVPIVGERFDAHDFIEKALSEGCAASLTARRDLDIKTDKALIYVPDTRKALGDLAHAYRTQFNIPFVAVTGSVGKTTAKELTAAVLAETFHILKTDGNFNNDIGLPLTLFRLQKEHQAAVIEMGMSGFGEIDALARITEPDFAIMTNIGLSHIEKLGSQENIYRAKAELFLHLSKNGTAVLNGDDPILQKHISEIPQNVITAGFSEHNDYYAKDIISRPESLSFTAVYPGGELPIHLNFPGKHNALNALFALAIGFSLGVTPEAAANALQNYVPHDRRMEFVRAGGITIINDCYNAAPASMEAGLKVLSCEASRSIAVLGDIKELGAFSESAHKAIGKTAAELSIDALFVIGEGGRQIAEGAKAAGMKEENIFCFDLLDTLNESLLNYVKPGDKLLVKASRAMHLETVTAFLVSHLQ